jgi:hypothetical protein
MAEKKELAVNEMQEIKANKDSKIQPFGGENLSSSSDPFVNLNDRVNGNFSSTTSSHHKKRKDKYKEKHHKNRQHLLFKHHDMENLGLQLVSNFNFSLDLDMGLKLKFFPDSRKWIRF